jgi:DNA-binding response OmpR family regulator
MLPAKRILVVDDDVSVCEFIALALSDEGYDVTTANNGQAALDCLKRVQPHLIILDLLMPVMSGQAFIPAYRARPKHHAPVIIISALAAVEAIAHDLTVEHFLFKPFNLDDLLTCVRQCLASSDGKVLASTPISVYWASYRPSLLSACHDVCLRCRR